MLKTQYFEDTIPNLQMMEGRRNRVKNKTPFKKWLEAESGVNVPTYLKQNFIPQDVSYKIDDFEEFYNERKNILRIALKEILINDG